MAAQAEVEPATVSQPSLSLELESSIAAVSVLPPPPPPPPPPPLLLITPVLPCSAQVCLHLHPTHPCCSHPTPQPNTHPSSSVLLILLPSLPLPPP